MKLTPDLRDRVAHNFTGLCLNAFDLLNTQKKVALAKPGKERVRPESFTNPEEFLRSMETLVPEAKPRRIKRVFPVCSLFRKKEARDVLGTEAVYRWFDFIVMARHNVRPGLPESLEPVYHAYLIAGKNPKTDFWAVEIIEAVSDGRHLLISDNKKSKTFSAGVVYYLVNEEIIPRLKASYKGKTEEEFTTGTFGVGCTAVQDYNARTWVVALPPL